MEAAKVGREEQLRLLRLYESGQPVSFKNHQGKDYNLQLNFAEDNKRPADGVVTFDEKAILYDAATHGDADAVLEYLKQGMDPNLRNSDGMTLLHQCCIENNLKLCSILLLNGADVNARDYDWWTPLHAAAACGHWRIANFLLTHGADATAVNADGELPLDIVEGDKCASLLNEEMTRLGIESDSQKDELRDKPHTRAMRFAEALLKEGRSLDVKDKHGITLMHVAASNGWLDLLDFLLKNKANPNPADDEGNTPLHLAVFFLQYKAAELLGKYPVNVDAKNAFEEVPIVLTEDITMMRLVKAIKEHKKVEEDLEKAQMERGSTMSLKRKSVSVNHVNIAKLEIVNAKEYESTYVELRFNRNKDGGDKSSSSSPPKKLNPLNVGAVPDDEVDNVTYAQIDHAVRARLAARQASERQEKNPSPVKEVSAPSSPTRSTPAEPSKPGEVYYEEVILRKDLKKEGSQTNTPVPTPLGTMTPTSSAPPEPQNPDLLYSKPVKTKPDVEIIDEDPEPKNKSTHPKLKETVRKGSLAAIAVEEEERKKNGGKSGGCCVIS